MRHPGETHRQPGAPMKVEIREISPASREVRELFRLLDAHNLSHCPAEICHLTQPEELQNDRSVLLGVFCDGELAGTGGLKLRAGYAEITRMFLKPEARGKGLAVRLLDALETIAGNGGYAYLMLETSEKFEPAMRLYMRYGFESCEPFGEYVSKAHNTYMKKRIAPAA
jgi:putative acetyltransferase